MTIRFSARPRRGGAGWLQLGRLALVLLAGSCAWAAAQPDLAPRALDPDELDAATVQRAAARFELDTIVYDVLDQTGVPGVVVALAWAGNLLAAEAYGTADVASGRALTLDDPLWLASITKTLTAIAVLDLAARGDLDLHAPLEQLLPGLVPQAPPGAAPLTPWHLLNHTSGFDTRILGTADMRAGASPPLAALPLPPRSQPPGNAPRYANANYHALGLAIEAATGQRYDAVMEALVFAPLGLESGRVTRPTDPAYEAASVPGHARSAGGALLPLVTPTVLDASAGAARLSGRDVALLLTHLTAAQPPGPLANDVRTALLSPAARAHPLAPGSTAGMLEGWLLGHDVVLQPGDLPGLHSLLVIVPEHALALFVHINGPARDGGSWTSGDGLLDPRFWLAERIVERFVGDARTPPSPVAAATLAPESQALAGVYRPAAVSRLGPEGFVGLGGLQQLRVSVGSDGSLLVATPAAVSAPRRYVPTASGAYVRDHGGDALLVTRDANGGSRLHGALGMPVTLELVPALERLEFVLASLAAAALAALFALVSWPLGWFYRWRTRQPRSSTAGGGLMLLRWSARLQAAGTVVWLALVLVAVDAAQRRLELNVDAWWPLASAALGVMVIAALVLILVGGLFALTGGSERRGPPLRPRAALHVLLGLAGLGLALQAWVWQLPPWR